MKASQFRAWARTAVSAGGVDGAAGGAVVGCERVTGRRRTRLSTSREPDRMAVHASLHRKEGSLSIVSTGNEPAGAEVFTAHRWRRSGRRWSRASLGSQRR